MARLFANWGGGSDDVYSSRGSWLDKVEMKIKAARRERALQKSCSSGGTSSTPHSFANTEKRSSIHDGKLHRTPFVCDGYRHSRKEAEKVSKEFENGRQKEQRTGHVNDKQRGAARHTVLQMSDCSQKTIQRSQGSHLKTASVNRSCDNGVNFMKEFHRRTSCCYIEDSCTSGESTSGESSSAESTSCSESQGATDSDKAWVNDSDSREHGGSGHLNRRCTTDKAPLCKGPYRPRQGLLLSLEEENMPRTRLQSEQGCLDDDVYTNGQTETGSRRLKRLWKLSEKEEAQRHSSGDIERPWSRLRQHPPKLSGVDSLRDVTTNHSGKKGQTSKESTTDFQSLSSSSSYGSSEKEFEEAVLRSHLNIRCRPQAAIFRQGKGDEESSSVLPASSMGHLVHSDDAKEDLMKEPNGRSFDGTKLQGSSEEKCEQRGIASLSSMKRANSSNHSLWLDLEDSGSSGAAFAATLTGTVGSPVKSTAAAAATASVIDLTAADDDDCANSMASPSADHLATSFSGPSLGLPDDPLVAGSSNGPPARTSADSAGDPSAGPAAGPAAGNLVTSAGNLVTFAGPAAPSAAPAAPSAGPLAAPSAAPSAVPSADPSTGDLVTYAELGGIASGSETFDKDENPMNGRALLAPSLSTRGPSDPDTEACVAQAAANSLLKAAVENNIPPVAGATGSGQDSPVPLSTRPIVRTNFSGSTVEAVDANIDAAEGNHLPGKHAMIEGVTVNALACKMTMQSRIVRSLEGTAGAYLHLADMSDIEPFADVPPNHCGSGSELRIKPYRSFEAEPTDCETPSTSGLTRNEHCWLHRKDDAHNEVCFSNVMSPPQHPQRNLLPPPPVCCNSMRSSPNLCCPLVADLASICDAQDGASVFPCVAHCVPATELKRPQLDNSEECEQGDPVFSNLQEGLRGSSNLTYHGAPSQSFLQLQHCRMSSGVKFEDGHPADQTRQARDRREVSRQLWEPCTSEKRNPEGEDAGHVHPWNCASGRSFEREPQHMDVVTPEVAMKSWGVGKTQLKETELPPGEATPVPVVRTESWDQCTPVKKSPGIEDAVHGYSGSCICGCSFAGESEQGTAVASDMVAKVLGVGSEGTNRSEAIVGKATPIPECSPMSSVRQPSEHILSTSVRGEEQRRLWEVQTPENRSPEKNEYGGGIGNHTSHRFSEIKTEHGDAVCPEVMVQCSGTADKTGRQKPELTEGASTPLVEGSTSSSGRDYLCTICLLTTKDAREKGILPCGHMFCFECICCWARTLDNPFCPICRSLFDFITMKRLQLDEEVVMPVPKRKKVGLASCSHDTNLGNNGNGVARCAVCEEGEDTSPLLTCTMCCAAVHPSCLERDIPSAVCGAGGIWVCDHCVLQRSAEDRTRIATLPQYAQAFQNRITEGRQVSQRPPSALRAASRQSTRDGHAIVNSPSENRRSGHGTVTQNGSGTSVPLPAGGIDPAFALSILNSSTVAALESVSDASARSKGLRQHAARNRMGNLRSRSLTGFWQRAQPRDATKQGEAQVFQFAGALGGHQGVQAQTDLSRARMSLDLSCSSTDPQRGHKDQPCQGWQCQGQASTMCLIQEDRRSDICQLTGSRDVVKERGVRLHPVHDVTPLGQSEQSEMEEVRHACHAQDLHRHKPCTPGIQSQPYERPGTELGEQPYQKRGPYRTQQSCKGQEGEGGQECGSGHGPEGQESSHKGAEAKDKSQPFGWSELEGTQGGCDSSAVRLWKAQEKSNEQLGGYGNYRAAPEGSHNWHRLPEAEGHKGCYEEARRQKHTRLHDAGAQAPEGQKDQRSSCPPGAEPDDSTPEGLILGFHGLRTAGRQQVCKGFGTEETSAPQILENVEQEHNPSRGGLSDLVEGSVHILSPPASQLISEEATCEPTLETVESIKKDTNDLPIKQMTPPKDTTTSEVLDGAMDAGEQIVHDDIIETIEDVTPYNSQRGNGTDRQSVADIRSRESESALTAMMVNRTKISSQPSLSAKRNRVRRSRKAAGVTTNKQKPANVGDEGSQAGVLKQKKLWDCFKTCKV